MARRIGSMPMKELAEISNTPLIDLSMLLLVTFLITYPLMEHGIHVNLPIGKADELEPKRTRTITVDDKGKLYLDNEPLSIEALAEQMNALGRADPEITVFVRGDKDIRYGRMVDVLKVLHDAKISRTALVTQAE